MSNAMLNIYVRVVKNRINEGEDLESILSDYTKLSDVEKEQIRMKLSD